MNADFHSVRSGPLSATIKAHGAELCSLSSGAVELLWQAGAAWPRHAPLLFPIVGRLNNDELRHRGKSYRMTQHGFARDLTFEWLERDSAHCALKLTDSAATQANYPFAFQLIVTYRLDAEGLSVEFKLINSGEETLPASLGGHPAFNWPLQPGLGKESYALAFSDDEPFPVRRLDGGLLREATEQNPVRGKTLDLSESLFADDAIIFDRLNSNSVRYAAGQGASAGPWVKMSWRGFRELGVWSKPSGAAFLCIEPWRGYASPAGFDGEFSDKPGLMHIAPGAEELLSYRIEVGSS